MAYTPVITIGGVDCSAWVKRDPSLRITDTRSSEPSDLTCVMTANKPTVGQTITVAMDGRTLFAGHVTRVTAKPGSTAGHPWYEVDATGYGRLLRSTLVYASYAATSASTIASALITGFASGITAAHVEAALASVTIAFDGVTVAEAMDRLAEAVGGRWYVDEDAELHFFVTSPETGIEQPDAAGDANTLSLNRTTDITQVATRVYVAGQSCEASKAVAGATSLEVSDGALFGTSGSALLPNNRITFSGKTDLAAPASAPTVGLGHGTSAQNITSLTRSNSTATCTTNTNHGYASGMAVRIAGCSTAAYNGLWSPITVTGLTTFTFSIGSTPGTSNSSGTVIAATAGDLVPGTYYYIVSYVGRTGETLTSSAGSVTVAGVADGSGSMAATTGGSMAEGTYYYAMSMVTVYGETRPALLNNPGTVVLSGGNNAVSLTSLTVPSDGRVGSKKLYRTKVGGTTDFYEVALLDVSATSYTDTLADTALTTLGLTEDRSGGSACALTGIAVSADSRVTARKVYRLRGSGNAADYRLVGTIPDNTQTSWTDTLSDDAVGEAPKAASTFPSLLTGIPASGAGSIATAITDGTSVATVVMAENSAAQTALAALDGTNGIREYLIMDPSLTQAQASARATAEVTVRKDPLVTISYGTTDVKTRSGTAVTFSALLGTYAAAVVADGPAGYWRLADTSGTTAVDSSGNTRNGTYSGTYTLNQAGLHPQGGSVHFNGGQVTIADNAAFRPSAITCECLCKLESGASSQFPRLIAKGGGAGLGYQMSVDTSYKGILLDIQGYGTMTSTANAIVVGPTYHVAFTYDGATIRIYINGVPAGQQAWAGPLQTASGTDLLIGNRGDGVRPWKGWIDEAAVYGKALTADQIRAHYDAWQAAAGETYYVQRVTYTEFYRGVNVPPTINVEATSQRVAPASLWRQLQR